MATGFGSVCIVVGVPAAGRPTTVRWAINLAAQVYPLNTAVEFCCPERKDGRVLAEFDSEIDVGDLRDYIVSYALSRRAPYIWFLDDDVLPPNNAVQRLMYAIRKNPQAMVCAGIYYDKRSDIPSPIVFKAGGQGPNWDWKQNEVFEVEGPNGFIGTGCMLVKTEIFQHIRQPWFKTLEYPQRVTDDAYFCFKVHEAGFKVLGHGGVLCGHFDWQTGKGYWPPGSIATEKHVTQQPVELGT